MAHPIPSEVRERIISAAVEIYEEGGRESWPTVSAVRRMARADMNTTSEVMREWRRAQTAQAAPVAVAVPEVVQQASSAAVATIWQQAQDLANASLRAAQAAWEVERVELDALRAELAEAFETQAADLEQARVDADAVRTELTAAEAAARGEADELRTELDRAHQDADKARGALAEQQKAGQAVAAQLDQVRGELAKVQAKAEANEEAHQEQRKQAAAEAHRMAERLTTAQAEREKAAKAAAQAREEAARMAGELGALKEQISALLARLTPAAPAAGAKKRG